MSLHFDMVINCDLREDTPEEIIEAIRYLTQKDYTLQSKPALIYSDHGNIWDSFYDKHFLAPDPDHDIISNFRRVHRLTIPLENNREVYRYRLQYCGSWLHDDFFAAHHMPFIYWLASIAYENYIGYYCETHNTGLGIQHFKVKDGKLLDQ
jgi:hypothetical protein